MLETLRQLRKAKGVTMKDVSDAVGVSVATVSLYERGLRSPSYEVLLKLGEYFDVSVDYLLNGSDSANQDNIVKNHAAIMEDERQKRIEELTAEIDELKRISQNIADGAYSLYSALKDLVGLDREIPRDVIFNNSELKQIQKEIEGLVVRFMEAATPEDRTAFLLRLDEIGLDFRQQMANIPPSATETPPENE